MVLGEIVVIDGVNHPYNPSTFIQPTVPEQQATEITEAGVDTTAQTTQDAWIEVTPYSEDFLRNGPGLSQQTGGNA